MREKLSLKHPEAYEWFWSEQVPSVVASFVNYFEGDPRFTSATAVYASILCYCTLTLSLKCFVTNFGTAWK